MRSATLTVLLAFTPLLWPPVPPSTPPADPLSPTVWTNPRSDLDPLAGARERRWVWPLSPRPEILRGFERPSTPWGPGHRGLDLAGRPDQRVSAAGAGTVTHAGPIAGRGVLVVAHSDGLRTTYEPVEATLEVGDTVRVGDPIGRLQPDGHCTGRVCLHWGLLRGSSYLDPSDLFEQRPRLLPYLSLDTPDSRPRMGLSIGTPQPVGGHMRVDLGGGQRSVAEQLLHAP